MRSVGVLPVAIAVVFLVPHDRRELSFLPFPVAQVERSAATLQAGRDRLVAGLDLSVEDSVAGDLMASGAVVSVTAPVAGDLLSAGARVTASSRVAGSVRAAGAEVTVAGPVGHNVTLAGGSVRIASTGRVEGNAYLAGAEVVIDGEVLGSPHRWDDRSSAGFERRIVGRIMLLQWRRAGP